MMLQPRLVALAREVPMHVADLIGLERSGLRTAQSPEEELAPDGRTAPASAR
jgi:hypothetical protein